MKTIHLLRLVKDTLSGLFSIPADVLGIYFDDKILNTDKKYFICTESVKEPIKLEFWLRELLLLVVEQN